MFFHVVNHFSPIPRAGHLFASTLLSARLARRASNVDSVLVVDGSEAPDDELRNLLEQDSIQYYHDGGRLSFAEGYNCGLSFSDSNYTILSASDIYAGPDVFAGVEQAFQLSERQEIGCVIPRLTTSDLLIQSSRHRMAAPIRVPLMTLNFNAFETQYVKSIGGVPDSFSGNFNDVEMALRMRRDGRSILLAPPIALHYGAMTTSETASSVSLAGDTVEFTRLFPEIADKEGFWGMNLDYVLDSRGLRALMKSARITPPRYRAGLESRLLKIGLQIGL